MTYYRLYNSPDERSKITFPFVWWDGFFDDNEINKIQHYCESQGLDRALVGTKSVPEESIRKANIQFFKYNKETKFIFDKMNWAISEINDRYYNFNLNGWDVFQYSLYDGKEGGKYDWHMDMMMGKYRNDDMHLTRKLSIILLLSEPGVDFEGGEFEINAGNVDKPDVPELKKGRILAFPSWMIHRVKPVTSGIRKSIAVWVLGPKFN